MRIWRRALIALLLLTLASTTACAISQPAKTPTIVNVAVIMYPGGGASPSVLNLYKAALEVTKNPANDYQLNMVTVTPEMNRAKQAPAPNEPPETVTALSQALAQDPAPDLVLFNSTFEFSAAIAQELLLDVDQYVRGDKSAPRNDYFPGAIDVVSDGGRMFGLPVSGGPTVLQYDKRLFDAAGLAGPPPNWTWSQFVDIGRQLTKASGNPATDQYAINLAYGPNVIAAFIWQNGGEIVSKDGRRALLGEPSAVEAIKFFDDLTNSYKIAAPMPSKGAMGDKAQAIARPPVAAMEGPVLMGPMGRVAMSYVSGAGSWYGGMPFGQGGEATLRFAELPRGKVPATILDLQTVIALTSKAKNPRTAYKAASALAAEMTKELPVPMRRSAAKNVRRMNPGISEEDAQIIVNALEYARPMPLAGSQKVMQPLYEKLLGPLQSGTKSVPEAVKEAVDAIDRVLNE